MTAVLSRETALQQLLNTHLVGRVHPVHLADVVTALRDALTPLLDRPTPPTYPSSVLTDREVDVLARVARGLSNEGIAAELHVSADTVKTHLQRLRGKLDARDRAHAVARGYQIGILGGDQ